MKIYLSVISRYFLFAFLVSCKTTESNEPDPLQWVRDSAAYKTEKTAEPFLKFAYADFQNTFSEEELVQFSRGGVLWQRFFMATESAVTLQEKDYVVAAKLQNQTYQSWDKQSACLISKNEATATRPTTLKAKISKPENSNGNVFYIYESASRSFVGIGAFNEKGEAVCSLPNIDLTISTGFGEARLETLLPSQQNTVEVALMERNYLSLQSAISGLQEGDLVRISRLKFERSDSNKSNEGWLNISQRIDDDIYQMISSPSDNFNANEQLALTFMVSKNSIKIPLEKGDYVATVTQAGSKKTCVQNFQISNVPETKLNCQFSKNRVPQAKRIEMNLDSVFWPKSFIQNEAFREALANQGIDFLLVEEKISDKEKKTFLMPSAESVFKKFDTKTTQLSLNNFSTLNSDDNHEEFLNLSTKIGVLTLEDVLKGSLPFSFLTTWTVLEPYAFQPDKDVQSFTNGIDIEITDPAVPSRERVDIGANSHVRGRVTVPAYHRADFLEIYVNGGVYKRIAVPRSSININDAIEFFFDERIEEKSDFYLSLVVWGESFLPETIFGLSSIKPFAAVNSICFDVDKDQKCSAKMSVPE